MVDKTLPKSLGAQCDICPLSDQPYALGLGPDKASLVICGEAPGMQEIQSGVPFTGKSGQLLNKILKYHGIERDEVYVTNATLCRPPGNAVPPTDAVKACFPRLIQELQSREPDTILALGNTASKILLDTRTGITELRTIPDGRSPYLPDTRVIPTFHPAAALRQPDLFPSIVSDVKKINAVKVEWEHTKFKVYSDDREAVQSLHQMGNQYTQYSLDIEIDVDDLRKIDAKHPNWLSIAISHRPGAACVYSKEVIEHPRFQFALRKLLADESKVWVYQNGKFDTQYLWSFAPEARVDFDTMLAHYATDERKGTHDLESLAVEVLGAPRYKTDAKQYLPRKGASLRYLPPNVLYQYNAADADVTHRLVDPLSEEMSSDAVNSVYRSLLIPGSNALARVEYLGVKVDRSILDRLASDLGEGLLQLESDLSRWVGNPRSPIQVRNALADLGFEVGSTNKEVLKEIDHEFTRLLLDHRTQAKLLSTYVVGLGRSLVRSRIHPTFLLHGTETGRLSCRRPNLQNIPSGSTIRDVFVSGQENILLSADYSQIEFRLAAILSGDRWLLEQFRSGREFHKEVARRFYGETWTDVQYLRAKAVNFGILYGRQAKSLADEWKMPFSEAQRMINTFFQQMPRVKEFQRDLERQIKEKGYLESYFGRKRRFWLVTRENWHEVIKEGYNFPLQSTASDLTLMALIRLEPLLRGKAAPIVTVHDSIMFEVKRPYLEEVAHTVKEVMEATPFADMCPTPIDIKVGTRWGSLQKYALGQTLVEATA